VDVAADHHGVHDRIDLGAAVIVLLHLGIDREQAAHLGRAAPECERVVGAHHEIDLAALEQVAELGTGGRLGEADVRRQLAAQAVGAALHPFDVARLYAVFVLQQPAHIDRRGHGVFRHAAAFALEVGGALDALVGVDEEVAVAEDPRRKYRDGDERQLAGAHQGGVVRERHFRDLELLELQHAPENVRGL
jgi:hypothetical protein